MNNAHGLDADYFIRLCAREFNPDTIRSQCPEDIARAFARAARTACPEVLQEPEFQINTADHHQRALIRHAMNLLILRNHVPGSDVDICVQDLRKLLDGQPVTTPPPSEAWREVAEIAGADLTNVRCQCCQAEHATDSYDAGFIAGSGMCQVCDAAIPAKDIHTPAARDVLAERQRQITAKDFDAGHDDMATGGQLADAAACYALWAGGINPPNWGQFWPWDREWLKQSEPRRMLVKAGALILAEIERLDRAEQAKQQEQQP